MVDDGSEPALDASAIADGLSFPLRLIRRTTQHGAHESRYAGLCDARAQRVLFLDDDVELGPNVLAEHAGVADGFAVGLIFYHPEAKTTAYQRYQSKLYEGFSMQIAREGKIPVSKFYNCNASGPTGRFTEIFAGVHATVGGSGVPGDGFDEHLLAHQLSDEAGFAQVLPRAVLLHIDSKTLNEARQERRISGQKHCRLILDHPDVQLNFREFAASFRSWKVRLFWIIPAAFRLVADAFSFVAHRAPAGYVPIWVCYPPMAIAFWDGIHSVAPRYEQLRALLAVESRLE